MTKHTLPRDADTENMDVTPEFSRRKFIGAATIVAAAGAATLIMSDPASAAKKSAQAKVKYQNTPKGDRKCSNCKFFEAETKTCKVVAGTISPDGWCVRFAKK